MAFEQAASHFRYQAKMALDNLQGIITNEVENESDIDKLEQVLHRNMESTKQGLHQQIASF
jgi:hypothetical protein